MILICKHCGHSKVNRPRGLCWSCYYTPGVKDLYPSTSKFARRGVGNFTGNAPLPEPTTALPGTPQKLEVLAQRARLKQALWHPLDATPEDSTARDPLVARPTSVTEITTEHQPEAKPMPLPALGWLMSASAPYTERRSAPKCLPTRTVS